MAPAETRRGGDAIRNAPVACSAQIQARHLSRAKKLVRGVIYLERHGERRAAVASCCCLPAYFDRREPTRSAFRAIAAVQASYADILFTPSLLEEHQSDGYTGGAAPRAGIANVIIKSSNLSGNKLTRALRPVEFGEQRSI